jgi:hypothetical protein
LIVLEMKAGGNVGSAFVVALPCGRGSVFRPEI